MIPRRFRAATLAAALLAGGAARAQSVADVYKGRAMEIIVGAGAGGGYDVNARLVARHLGAFTPGAPSVVVANMPGGGGITATNFLYNVAPKNGLVLGTFSNAMLTQPLFGADSVKFETGGFGWLGSTSREDGVCIASRASGARSLDDLRRRRLVVGTTAPGTTTHLFPTLLNRVFGFDFKFVTGYADGGQVVLALERGEIEALCQTWSSLKIAHPEWVPQGRVQPLVSIGLGANPELAGLPSIMDLARDDEQRAMLEIVLAPTLAGRPFALPPGVPAERLDALRKAFVTMTQSAAFIEDARRARVELSPADGLEIDGLLRRISAAPPALVAKVRAIVEAAPPR